MEQQRTEQVMLEKELETEQVTLVALGVSSLSTIQPLIAMKLA